MRLPDDVLDEIFDRLCEDMDGAHARLDSLGSSWEHSRRELISTGLACCLSSKKILPREIGGAHV